MTTAGTVQCTHPTPGGVVLIGSAKLRVGGQPVLVATDVVGATVACPTPLDPNTGTKPCTTVAKVTGGFAAKLEANEKPVLLEGFTGSTDGTPPPTGRGLRTSAGQTRLRAGGV